MRASLKTLVVAPLLALAVPTPALAQTGTALASYPPCTNKPTAQDSEAAHSAYNLGKRFFDEADYTTAIHNFADAYKLDCTKPELLLNIARANELLGNRTEAVHALETYLQRATNATEDDRSQLQRRIDNLKALIAQQTPATPAPPPPAPPPVIVTPPVATPAPPPPPLSVDDRHHTVPPWIAVGVGGAAVIAGGVLYLVGANDVSTARTQCHNDTTNCASSSAVSTGLAGDHLETAGQVLFWSGLGVAAAGVLWHFLEPTGPVKDAPKASLVPSLGPGYAGANVIGSF